jgi:hypothetical protein
MHDQPERLPCPELELLLCSASPDFYDAVRAACSSDKLVSPLEVRLCDDVQIVRALSVVLRLDQAKEFPKTSSQGIGFPYVGCYSLD